jgi:hypothetical protein
MADRHEVEDVEGLLKATRQQLKPLVV